MTDQSYSDAVAEVYAHLSRHPRIIAEVGDGGVTGDVRGPFPHIQVTNGPVDDLRDLRWDSEQQVDVFTIGDPGGFPSKPELRRVHMVTVGIVGAMPDREYAPTDAVIGRVRPVATMWAPLPDGSGRWRTTLSVVIHPPVEV